MERRQTQNAKGLADYHRRVWLFPHVWGTIYLNPGEFNLSPSQSSAPFELWNSIFLSFKQPMPVALLEGIAGEMGSQFPTIKIKVSSPKKIRLIESPEGFPLASPSYECDRLLGFLSVPLGPGDMSTTIHPHSSERSLSLSLSVNHGQRARERLRVPHQRCCCPCSCVHCPLQSSSSHSAHR